MRITRRGAVAIVAGMVVVISGGVLVANRAGGPDDGQIAVSAVTSTAGSTSDQPGAATSTTRSSSPTRTDPTTTAGLSTDTGTSVGGVAPSTTRRSPASTTTTRPKATKPTVTSKPPANPKLTLAIENVGEVAGVVQVSPGGGTCKSTCNYDKFSKGTAITLTATPETVEFQTKWVFGGGQSTCSQQGTCEFTLTDVTTVTAIFDINAGGG